MRDKKEKRYEEYLGVYNGQQLLESHSLEEEGCWLVTGEPQNVDYSGCHHGPNIGVVEGKLENVIKWAVMQHNFWTWGGGRKKSLSKCENILDNPNNRDYTFNMVK